MKLTKLCLLISSIMVLTGCGIKPKCCEPAPTTTLTVQVDRYSSEESQLMSVDSLSNTIVCFDTNMDNSCRDETSAVDLKSTTGRVNIETYRSLQNIYIVAENSEFVYKIHANEDNPNDVLYLNPVTDAATRFGKEGLKEITGYTGDAEDFSPSVELEENLEILANCIDNINQDHNLGNNTFDSSKIQEQLEGVFPKIIKQLNMGLNSTQIVANILTGNDNPVVSDDNDNTPPVAAFDIVTKDNGLVSFENKSFDNEGDDLKYKWRFGDGSISYQKDPEHQFISNGTFKVQLLVSDGGNSSVINKTLTLSDVPVVKPTFDFNVEGFTVKFTNTTNIKDVEDVEYLWDFGDGNTSTEISPTYTYPQEGEYEVTLQLKAKNQEPVLSTQLITITDNPDLPTKPDEPVIPKIDVDVKALVLGNRVFFTSEIDYTGENQDKLTYHWEFGDGNKSSNKNTTHAYAKYGNYEVLLTVSDGLVSKIETAVIKVSDDNHNVLCTPEEPFCKGQIDPVDCAQTCVEERKTVCTGDLMMGVDLASVYQPSVDTPHYATNPNNQKGVYKTITSMRDWTSDMIIAQGAANDDPKSFYGNHEIPTDLYALYAAYDDQNLYLMIEMPNLNGHEVGSEYDYTALQSIPMGIGIRTGQRISGNGLMADGNTVWHNQAFYEIKEGIDTLLMFTPNLVKGKGILYKTNSEGKFTYDAGANGYEMTFEEAGITSVVEHASKSANYWGFADNKGKDSTFYLEDGYTDLLVQNPQASGHLYQLTIPLESLDVTRDFIKSKGIGVMVFTTMGQSMMDALPWTPNLVDNANLPFSFDNSTTYEKEDFDIYEVSLAEIGDEHNFCNIILSKKCTPEVVPEICTLSENVDVVLNHKYQINDEQVIVFLQAFTGYIDIQYEWKVIGAQAQIIPFDDRTKAFIFNKNEFSENASIIVNVKNNSGTKKGSTSFAVGNLK